MTTNIAHRIRDVQSPIIPIVGRWTADHPGTISLGQGVVHYAPPAAVTSAVTRAVQEDPNLNRYGPVCGDERLIELIRHKLHAENGIDISPSESLVCTAGSNMGFLNAVLALGDTGDEFILLSPYYFNHHMAIQMAGCRPVIVPTDANYQIDLEAISTAITPRTRAVVTISPNNPTGAVYPPDDLAAVNALCASRGITHISDEAYEYFLYEDARHLSAASIPGAGEHTISLFSLSKAYGMAGWRLGYMVIPNKLLEAIQKIQDTNLICPPAIGQTAARAALKAGSTWCRQQFAPFAQVRSQALQELAGLGERCRVPQPTGAFYMLLQLQTAQDDMTLVERLIRDHGVAVLPGSAFGVSTPCSLRVSYGALDPALIGEGLGRLRRGLEELLGPKAEACRS